MLGPAFRNRVPTPPPRIYFSTTKKFVVTVRRMVIVNLLLGRDEFRNRKPEYHHPACSSCRPAHLPPSAAVAPPKPATTLLERRRLPTPSFWQVRQPAELPPIKNNNDSEVLQETAQIQVTDNTKRSKGVYEKFGFAKKTTSSIWHSKD